MRNLVNFPPTTQKSKNFTSKGYFCPKCMRFDLKNTEELSFMTLSSDPFVQSIQRFRWKSTEVLCLMTLKSDARFEEKLTLGSKNDTRSLVNFKMSSGKLVYEVEPKKLRYFTDQNGPKKGLHRNEFWVFSNSEMNIRNTKIGKSRWKK